jgi:hypothetical protein
MSDDEVIDTICDLATTGMWSVFDVTDLYKDKLPGRDIWELCKRMMGEGLVRIDSRGILNVYH